MVAGAGWPDHVLDVLDADRVAANRSVAEPHTRLTCSSSS
jgi:hypothetical protein